MATGTSDEVVGLAGYGRFGRALGQLLSDAGVPYRAYDPDSDVPAPLRAASMQELARGAAFVVDHHASPNAIDGSLDRIASALDEVGVRGALCYETTDRDGPERREAGLRESLAAAASRRVDSLDLSSAGDRAVDVLLAVSGRP